MARRPPKKTGSVSQPSASKPGGRPVRSLRITMPAASSTSAPKPGAPSSAVPSSSAADSSADVDKIDIASLTFDTPLVPLVRKRRVPATPFHFLSLPSEIRIDIYAYFFHDIDDILDLGPGNYKQIHKKLGLMRVCKQVHDEACYYFYSSRTFRIFPVHPGKYFKTKKPLLARLKQHQRRNITSLQLRLGPGWAAPPRGWVINPALGLQDCTDVEILKVFVQCDPSDAIYRGFRQPNGFYEGFCRDLLRGILEQLPSVQIVEFDGFTGVRKCGEMMRSLLDVATKANRLIGWGPERGWTDDMHEDDDVEPPKLSIWLEEQ